MKKIPSIKAQSTLEYVIVIVCLVAALIAMQIYIKRSMQGRLKDTADSLGTQYDPQNTTSDITLSQNSNVDTVVTTTEDGDKTRTVTTVTINTQEDKNYGNETVGKFE